MWYFTWILGFGFACFFSILNAMWLEHGEAFQKKALESEEKPGDE